MSITRSTHDVGYFPPAEFGAMNISQIVRASGLVFFSGVVAVANGKNIAVGDPAGQVRAVLDTLERLLHAEKLTWANLVSVTVYSPVLEQIQAELGQFSARFAGNPPCFTMIGVKNLGTPSHLLEVTAIAGAG